MQKPEPKVVVITGASGGLGRQTAIEFARLGWRVVLAARRAESLEQTAAMCRDQGGEALVKVTDVTSEADVAALARAALDEWGAIDVWVNNAGVTLFALLEEGPFEEHRRVIETNLFGAIYAARSVIPVFRRQKRGVMINVGSILSKVGQPAVPSYVISKFALRGMSEALRTALADEPDIHVCTILPYAIDTPHFQSGANEIGIEAHAMPPVQSPEHVARAIVRLAEHPKRETHVPGFAVLGLAVRWLLPTTSEKLILHAVNRWHLGPHAQPRTDGNLYDATHEHGAVHGHRPPRISALALGAWIASDLLTMQARVVWKLVSPLLAHVPARSDAPAPDDAVKPA
jgi:NAD(P)-dependent dehydrogenase (short-subunit alcohol dehydrogenase family)